MDAKFRELVSKIRTDEVRGAIEYVHSQCEREVRTLRIFFGVCAVLFLAHILLVNITSFTTASPRLVMTVKTSEINPPTSTPVPAAVVRVEAPAPTATSAPTATPDLWKEVRDCQIEAVMFQVASGNIENEYQKQWKAYENRYEIWAVALFSNADPEKYRTDHWNNKLLYQISGDRMPFESLAKLPVRVFSENGMIGDNDYWTGGAVRLTHPVNCKPLTTKADKIIWTDTSALKLLTEVKGSRGEGTSATSRFFVGGPMTDEEIRAMIIAAQHSEGWTNWVGSGFLGYGSSSGNFEILDDGTLTWGYFFNGPLVDVGVKIPANTEVVVVTSVNWTGYATPWLKAQRFIWTDVQGLGGGWRMIEQEPANISQSALDYLLNK